MPIRVDWANEEHTAILQTFDNQWSWRELIKVSEVEHILMDQVRHPVHIIADVRQTSLPPGVMKQIPRIARASQSNTHPNGGVFIVVGGSPLMESFARVYARATTPGGRTIYFVRTLDEAFALVTQTGLPVS